MKKKEDIPEIEKKLWEEYLKNPKDIFDKELGNKKQFDLMADIEDSKYSYLPLYFWFNNKLSLQIYS